jgi:hypothetical protein
VKRFLLVSLFSALARFASADLVAGAPSPGERILIIWTDAATGTYDTQMRDAFVAALGAIVPAPTIDQVLVSAGDGGSPGFYNELLAQTGESNLNDWCQVYDLRFRDDRNNLAFTGQNQEDVITYLGANNDTQLFTNYLNAGGSLFLQGEHHDYYIRDTNLFAFINSVANAPVTMPSNYAGVRTGAATGGAFPAAPENFNTDFNNIAGGSINTNFAGGIYLAMRGSGQPIGTTNMNADGGFPMTTALAWLSGDLRTNGRLVVNFESNAFTEPALKNATSDAWIQNVYDLLSGCYRYTVTKAFTPTELCVGDAGTFQICYTNLGKALSNYDIWDTLPNCLSFSSSTPAPTSGSGQFRRWNFPTIGVGASACVTVNFTVSCYP